MTGIIKTYIPSRKFGFVQGDDGVETFFHIANSPALTPELGLRVMYDLAPPVQLGKPPMAVKLSAIIEGGL